MASSHYEYISLLMEVLKKLSDKASTVLIVKHNMDLIKSTDI